MNKRADISITILVIGVFALCGFAILSFYISDINAKEGFEALDLIEQTVALSEDFYFYQNVSQDPLKMIIYDQSTFEIIEEVDHYRITGNYSVAKGVPGFRNKKQVMFVEYLFRG